MTKKLVIMLLVVVMLLALSVPALAHPPHNEGEAGKANANAADGLHRAAENVADANGRAAHVLLYWVGPGPGHGGE